MASASDPQAIILALVNSVAFMYIYISTHYKGNKASNIFSNVRKLDVFVHYDQPFKGCPFYSDFHENARKFGNCELE